MGNETSSSRNRGGAATRTASANTTTPSAASSANRQAPPATPSPGAYTVSSQARGDQRFYVTIPRGIRPGQHFAVLVNGQQMMVRCPPGNGEGDRLVVTAPRQQAHNYVVTVPPNVRPGRRAHLMSRAMFSKPSLLLYISMTLTVLISTSVYCQVNSSE